ADLAQLMELLNTKEYAPQFKDKFLKGFQELHEKLEHSNEVAAVKNMRYESDTLKQRYISEMETYEHQLAQKAQQQADQAAAQTPTSATAPAAPQPAPQPIKRTKTVSLRTVTHGKTVRLQSEQDVDKLLGNLKESLMQELADGDINLMM
ncbi:MAG: hypothetical protein RR336_03750, partial [Oscillospiraceae bacterium]